jgi:uracil-DNA glycosylase
MTLPLQQKEPNPALEWHDILQAEKLKPYYLQIQEKLAEQRKITIIYPPPRDVFKAIELTPFDATKVVIIGQDPYHGPNQAHGLSFSVPHGIKPPPSLRNIFKELHRDLGTTPSSHGNLEHWAKQGVLLLNSVLTVEKEKPGSHTSIGWQAFTDHIISKINQHAKPTVFMLWGAAAKKKNTLITKSKHLVLTAPHPSPLSAHRGFLGCCHFSECNRWLQSQNRQPIDWVLRQT